MIYRRERGYATMLAAHLLILVLSLQLLAPSVAPAAEPATAEPSVLEIMSDGPDFLTAGIGIFDFAPQRGEPDEEAPSAALQLEYHAGRKLYLAGPLAGVVADHLGGVYGYGGIYFDVALGPRLRLTPILAAGGYHDGSSEDLGGPFAFHVGGSLAWTLPNGARAGLSITHVSNAYLYDENPGAELIFVTWAQPIAETTR